MQRNKVQYKQNIYNRREIIMVCGAGFIKAEIENEVLAEAMKKFRNKNKPETVEFTLAYAIRQIRRN